jgi:hypothetical protein
MGGAFVNKSNSVEKAMFLQGYAKLRKNICLRGPVAKPFSFKDRVFLFGEKKVVLQFAPSG